MSKKEVNLFDVFDHFKDSKDENMILFQFIQSGQSWGAKKKGKKEICAKVSIAVPYEICNPENRNLAEIRNYYGFVLFVPKEKVDNFVKIYNEHRCLTCEYNNKEVYCKSCKEFSNYKPVKE